MAGVPGSGTRDTAARDCSGEAEEFRDTVRIVRAKAALRQNSVRHQPLHRTRPRVVRTHTKTRKALRYRPSGLGVEDADEHRMLGPVDPRHDAQQGKRRAMLLGDLPLATPAVAQAVLCRLLIRRRRIDDRKLPGLREHVLRDLRRLGDVAPVVLVRGNDPRPGALVLQLESKHLDRHRGCLLGVRQCAGTHEQRRQDNRCAHGGPPVILPEISPSAETSIPIAGEPRTSRISVPQRVRNAVRPAPAYRTLRTYTESGHPGQPRRAGP